MPARPGEEVDLEAVLATVHHVRTVAHGRMARSEDLGRLDVALPVMPGVEVGAFHSRTPANATGWPMTRRWFTLRLEPVRPAGDTERGFAAEVADPAWFLGRQWQLGEHRGENASSPLQVDLEVRRVPIGAPPSRPDLDPQVVPTEAIVEDEPGSWWTVGRRLRLGRAARDAGLVGGAGAADDGLRCDDLTGPYAALNGLAYDGRKVFAAQPDAALFAEVPPPFAPDAWSNEQLGYRLDLPAGDATLSLGGRADPSGRWVGHDGGDVDWWSVDADQPVTTGASEHEPPAGPAGPGRRWPERFSLPGGPARRWWQLEDRQVDLGGSPPDRSHFASVLLLDLLFGHGDDWFLTPLTTVAGRVLVVDSCTVTDAFDETWTVTPADGPPPVPAPLPWSLFEVAGLGPNQLPIWLSALSPLSGDPVEQVIVGQDEDANLVWAVEERLDGVATRRTRPSPSPVVVRDETGPLGPPPTFRYELATAVADHWHPYTREGDDATAVRFRQGRLLAVDDAGLPVGPMPLPTAHVLQDDGGGVHAIAPWRLPPTGLRLERRPMLARTTTGQPVLWVQRRRTPLLAMPSSGLRFDALSPEPA